MARRELFGLEDQGSTTYPFSLIRDHSFGVEGDQGISGWAATNLSRLVAEPGSKGAARDQSKVLTLGAIATGRDERSFWR